MKHVLFVTYGGGHVSMVIPVAQALQAGGGARVTVLALTTAAQAVRQAGLEAVQFSDFVQPGDEAALAWGRELAQTMDGPSTVAPEETQAYLGLSFSDLVARHGLTEARALYAQYGRHCFLPVPTLQRILQRMQPDLVVLTNSPRAERAAGLAARALGIPALCINSLFAIDEIAWIGQPGYCDRVCVLNEAIRDKLLAAGRQPAEIVVTGNPSFDALFGDVEREAGRRLRASLPPGTTQIAVWASQPELPAHPTAPGKTGDPALPARILDELLAWANQTPGRHLLVRPHPNETLADPQSPNASVWRAGDWGIAAVLNACDAVVTMTSTVAVQAYAMGLPVLQVRGSIYDHSMPLKEMGMAVECVPGEVAGALEALLASGRLDATGRDAAPGHATARVAQVIQSMLA